VAIIAIASQAVKKKVGVFRIALKIVHFCTFMSGATVPGGLTRSHHYRKKLFLAWSALILPHECPPTMRFKSLSESHITNKLILCWAHGKW